jgi:hypothetical protein
MCRGNPARESCPGGGALNDRTPAEFAVTWVRYVSIDPDPTDAPSTEPTDKALP